MTLIEPHRFVPFEAGNTTSVTLPGLSQHTQVDVLRINSGLVLAHSHFSPDIKHDDNIRRPEDQLILAFNLSGRMRLVDPRGQAHDITDGQGWIIRSGGKQLKRIVKKGDGCSNLVIALSVSRLAPELFALLERALPETEPFRRLRLPVPGNSALETLLDGRTDPAAMLRKEGQCLALLGHALEEIVATPASNGTSHDHVLLVERVTAFLAEHLSDTITMAEVERRAGLSHVTVNQIFRTITGMTVFERVRALRMEAAERLIHHTNRSFTDIAGECGFSDASHLSNAFRKRYGMTASDWRRAQQENS
ncbi:AraC family transcriptional regulator [Agrobacterium sp.]|uniref:AraC family transcriptional regulator n=1 Tax=Agrobacterium sp. TaxID=361 RepID=UPI0028A67237|nr:AraC family transcriptional regulator [Agrobacterium sp.]